LYGVYRGINEKGFGVLHPHVVFEPVNPLAVKRDEMEYECVWETSVPKRFLANSIISIDVLIHGLLKKMVPNLADKDLKQYLEQ